jgi:hypothetical protein
MRSLAALARLLLLLAGFLLPAALLLLAGLLAWVLILLARLLIGVAHVRFSLADTQLAITASGPIGCGATGFSRTINVSMAKALAGGAGTHGTGSKNNPVQALLMTWGAVAAPGSPC